MKTLRWLIFGVVLVAAVVFAVGNRQTALVSLDPMPYTVEMPVYLLVFLAIATGILLMAATTGASQARRARRRRQAERDNARLRAENDRLKARAALTPGAGSRAATVLVPDD
jgi:uncharacterized integral membrane protein